MMSRGRGLQIDIYLSKTFISERRNNGHLWRAYSNVCSFRWWQKFVFVNTGKSLFDCLLIISRNGERMFLGIANFWDMTQQSCNLHIWHWQTVVYARFARTHVFFHFCAFQGRSRPFEDGKWPEFCRCVDDVRTWRQLNFLLCLPISEALILVWF